MKIRRFTAADMEGALRQVRAAFGPRAVVIETRRGTAGSPGSGVTVVAAVDREVNPCESPANIPINSSSDDGPGSDPFPLRLRRAERDERDAACRPALSVAVTSGKGGVGKTSVAANLAILLGQMGRRVILVDGDFGLANVDLMLGLTPRYTLQDVASGRRRIDEALLDGPAGIRVLPAASGDSELVELDDYRRELLLRALSTAFGTNDALIIDTGSGIHRLTLRLAQLAEHILVLTTPEPPSFSDAYAMMKTLSGRRLAHHPHLIVNRVRDDDEAVQVAERVRRVSARFLGFTPELWGAIPEDESLPAAVRSQQPLVTAFPDAPASKALWRLAQRIAGIHDGPAAQAAMPPAGHVQAA